MKEDLLPWYKQLMKSVGKYRFLVLLGLAAICLVVYACSHESAVVDADQDMAAALTLQEMLSPLNINYEDILAQGGTVTVTDTNGTVLNPPVYNIPQKIIIKTVIPVPGGGDVKTYTVGVQLDGSDEDAPFEIEHRIILVPGYEGETH